MKQTLFVLFFMFLTTMSIAKDLGKIGETYPIIENDLLRHIQTKISMIQENGQWKILQKIWRKHAQDMRDRPKATNISTTLKNKTWRIDPSITLSEDIVDAKGQVIVARGTRVNPLEHVAFKKVLVFYNADDPKQQKWASDLNQKREQANTDKFILVRGSLLTEEKRLARPIYFDQSARLIVHFGIEHVPALVTVEGLLLRIEEQVP